MVACKERRVCWACSVLTFDEIGQSVGDAEEGGLGEAHALREQKVLQVHKLLAEHLAD